ncbi:glycosyltransferase family 2 protein [Thermodesulfovibrio hydrogeniphilus]
MFCLDERYSTTRCVTEEKPQIINRPEDKFETLLFLPPGEGRQGEGGLRTKGYFKKSYKDKPLISVITVVLNGEKYLEETIQSVLNQTYDNVEYIIIDGGSTDGTLDIIKKYEDYIDYWVSEKDKGIYDAMNKGIDVASGEWINFMNAGDGFYERDVIAKIFEREYKDVGIICGDFIAVHDNQKVLRKPKPLYKFYRYMCLSHQSAFININLMKKLRYNQDYRLAADYEFFLRAFYKEKVIFNYVSLIVNYIEGNVGFSSNLFLSYYEDFKANWQLKTQNPAKLIGYYIFRFFYTLIIKIIRFKFFSKVRYLIRRLRFPVINDGI